MGRSWFGGGVLLRGEAIEQTCATSADQIRLAATLGGVCVVPGRRVRAAALAIMVTDLRTARAIARPVVTGVVGPVGKRRAIQLGASQNIVRVRSIATTIDDGALFGELRFFGELVGVAVQVGDVGGDLHPLRVEPRPRANAIFRVDWFAIVDTAQVGPPRTTASTGRRGQFLAMRVRPGEAAKVGAIAAANAGNEKSERWLSLREHRTALKGEQGRCREQK